MRRECPDCGEVYLADHWGQFRCHPCGAACQAAASRRHMLYDNPMRDDATRLRMQKTLLDIGHKPKKPWRRGELSVSQRMLHSQFPEMKLEHIVSTSSGVYRLDLACTKTRLCVECDGPSHQTRERKAHDQLRDTTLEGLGWTVLRFKNKTVENNVGEVVETIQSCMRSLSEKRLATSQTES
jgi:very-short-patch-repair endonuclease